jgi:hypothetical protein
LGDEEAGEGAGYADDDVLVEQSPGVVVDSDVDDPASGMPAEGAAEEQLEEELLVAAAELAAVAEKFAQAEQLDDAVRAEEFSVSRALRELHEGAGVPVIESVSAGLEYLKSIKR